jgi:3-isopropylmalate/(R)-2-methylmalate dehydratase small subunit
MKPFTNFESRVVPLPINNIDTDQIIPARFLKTTSKQGLDRQLFNDWRYDAQGNPKPDFILNQPRGQNAQVLLAGDNFGCGSSREHAPWALTQFGFRAVDQHLIRRHLQAKLAEEFPAPDRSSARRACGIIRRARCQPGRDRQGRPRRANLTTPSGRKVEFPVDSFSKHCLLEGVDELGYILAHEADIAAFESKRVGSVNTAA